MFPKIDSPCPLKWKTLPSAGRDFCTVCRRRVHNLDAMTMTQWREFFAACSDTVCVAYTVRRPRRPVAAAATLGLAACASLLSPAIACTASAGGIAAGSLAWPAVASSSRKHPIIRMRAPPVPGYPS